MNVRNQKYLKAFGNNLKLLIKEKNMTPEQVGALAGIETKQVYRIINAEHSVSLSILVSIANGMDIHLKDLFDF